MIFCINGKEVSIKSDRGRPVIKFPKENAKKEFSVRFLRTVAFNVCAAKLFKKP